MEQLDRRLTLKPGEVARMLGKSESAIYDAIKRNQIPHIEIGKSKVVPRAWLEQQLGMADATPAHTEDAAVRQRISMLEAEIIGRQAELDALKEEYGDPRPRFVRLMQTRRPGA